MRKTVVTLALALALPAVFAQGTPAGVQLYGIVDAGFENIDNGAVSMNRLTSGVSTGSRWGLRGGEDLGGGYRALFTLEARLEVDTGDVTNRRAIYYCGTPVSCPGVTLIGAANLLPPAVRAGILGGINKVLADPAALSILPAVSQVNPTSAIFDRQSFAGLVTPFGAFLFGRQYTPNYEVLIKFNSFADSFAGNPGQLAAINIRASNAFQYRAELRGFTASLMYGFGGTEFSRSERDRAPTRGDDFVGVNLQYNSQAFGIGVGYNRNNTVTFAAPNQNRKGLETFSVGGTTGVGPVKLFATYLKAKNENPVLTPADIQNIVIAGGSEAGILALINSSGVISRYNRFDVDALRGLPGPIDMTIYHLGLQWQIQHGTLLAAVNRAKDTARSPWATADATVDQLGLAYFHNLSRRSQLYLAGALANNKDEARIGLGAACCTGGWTTARGEDSRVLQLGMRHTF